LSLASDRFRISPALFPSCRWVVEPAV
jgi:hypothetical protein